MPVSTSAQTEDLSAKTPQMRRLHLQPEQEQEHQHVQFGSMQDRLRLIEQTQPE